MGRGRVCRQLCPNSLTARRLSLGPSELPACLPRESAAAAAVAVAVGVVAAAGAADVSPLPLVSQLQLT